jgi:hypothetical protein
MEIAIVVGHCWSQMVRAVPARLPVREENVLLIGGRSATQVEKERSWASSGGAGTLEELMLEGVRSPP